MKQIKTLSTIAISEVIILVVTMAISGCTKNMGGATVVNGLPTIHMPFETGTSWLCTQGANGSYSHQGTATKFDADFDTPNAPATLATVRAPISGTARVHYSNTGFGNHINIDLDDGTYVLMAHLESIFIQDGHYLQIGEPVGLAGTSGNSDGEHLHYGIHKGDPAQNGVYGESIPHNIFAADKTAGGSAMVVSTENLICGIQGGHRYESQLPQAYGPFQSDSGNQYEPDPEPTPDPEPEPDQEHEQDQNQANPYYQATLCWLPEGLVNPRNGELWVADVTWWTLAENTGTFQSLCGTLQVESGDTLIVNGEFTANNVPSSPWWICSNWGQNDMRQHGYFTINGEEVNSAVQEWGSGCDSAIQVP